MTVSSPMLNPIASRPSGAGFTMTELMVTIAILVILLSLAVPSMTRFISDWRLSNAVNALSGSLRTARIEAMSRGKRVIVCQVNGNTTCPSTNVTTNFNTGWIVFVDNDGTNSFTANDQLILQQSALTGITAIQSKTNSFFTFQPSGLLAGTFDSFNFDSSSFQSASATPWARKALCITKSGRVRFTDDNTNC
jgi:type IV fimbrial biogenesis protein FimT